LPIQMLKPATGEASAAEKANASAIRRVISHRWL
jgi:hypothetical protein